MQAVTKRAGRKKDTTATAAPQNSGGGRQQVKKAVFESTKKKEVGVSDLTLLSKISNEAINDNLKKRFENAEIYVGLDPPLRAGDGAGQSNPLSRRTSAMCWFRSTLSEIVRPLADADNGTPTTDELQLASIQTRSWTPTEERTDSRRLLTSLLWPNQPTTT